MATPIHTQYNEIIERTKSAAAVKNGYVTELVTGECWLDVANDDASGEQRR